MIQPGNSITVNGTNFNSGSTVRIGIGSTLHTASTTFASSSKLTFTAPSESNGTYHFSVVDPSGVDIPYVAGITYSGVTISHMDPHEWSTAGGDAITVTGAGFDSGTTLTIGGGGSPCTSIVIVSSQTLTCNVPAGSVGIPAVALTSAAGGPFTSGTTDPVLFKGYASHPYLTGVSLSTLQTKWANSSFADYVSPLKRNVAVSAFLSGVSGTFNVGDTVTQGGTTGICYGVHYGFAVLFATSGTYAPGAISDTTSGASATIVVIGTIPGMQASFTAAVTSVTGTFNPGDVVTQGVAKGLVYSYGGGVIGIMPMVSSFASTGVYASQNPIITGPSGTGTLSLAQTQNSPYDGSANDLGGWAINSWQDYAWYDLFANSSKYDTPLWNGTTLLGGADGLTAALNRVSWVDQQQYFALEGESVPVADFYDWAFPLLSQTQKTQILNYLDKVHSLCTTLISQNAVFFQTAIAINNWDTVSNGACLQVYLAEQNSVYSVLHGGTPDVNRAVTNLRSTDPTYSVASYATTTIDNSGVGLEGSQYTQFGMVNYTAAGIACQSATGSGSCNVAGTAILSMPNYLLQSIQPDLTYTGDSASQWQTFNDTQPQAYGAAYLADQCDRLSNPTLCFVADTIQHQIATTDAFAGHLNWQASRGSDYGLRAFLYRSATSGSFGGWSTARYDPSNAYAVLRSATTLNPSLVCGVKGTNASQINQGHRHADGASFVCQTQGENKFLDPGYFLTGASSHSTVSVDGTFISALIGPTSFDTTNFIDSPNFWGTGIGKESVAIDYTPSLGAAVTQARRTVSTYGAKAFIVLDDIIATGAGNVAELFQAQGSVAQTGTSNVTSTITGANSNLACTFYGPVSPGGNSWATSVVAGNFLSGGPPSWVFANLGTVWNTIHASYNAPTGTNANPLLMACIDSVGGAGLTVSSVTNSGTVITVAFSDGHSYVYNLTGGKWILQ